MKLTLNGEFREIPESKTVSDLLRSLGLGEKLVLVEQNGQPVPREEFPATSVRDGDKIEIVRMVAGG
jgi:thiamine biosynthesis protein ThiS